MTLAVYTVNPTTGARTLVRAQHTVKPSKVPDYSSSYPPCACSRCSAAGMVRGKGRAR